MVSSSAEFLLRRNAGLIQGPDFGLISASPTVSPHRWVSHWVHPVSFQNPAPGQGPRAPNAFSHLLGYRVPLIGEQSVLTQNRRAKLADTEPGRHSNRFSRFHSVSCWWCRARSVCMFPSPKQSSKGRLFFTTSCCDALFLYL
jgi:hypothetical protein